MQVFTQDELFDILKRKGCHGRTKTSTPSSRAPQSMATNVIEEKNNEWMVKLEITSKSIKKSTGIMSKNSDALALFCFSSSCQSLISIQWLM